jgi:uncharacterized membrane protein YhaH (DUF805 family)
MTDQAAYPAPSGRGWFREFTAQFFSAHGRTNRAKYWLATLIATTIYVAGIGFLIATKDTHQSPRALVAVIALFIPAAVISVLASIRRLHDRDMSGHFLWLFYLVPAILDGVAKTAKKQHDGGEILAGVCLLISLTISIWAFVELGCRKGTIGPNRFGSDPLGRAQALSE